MNIVETATHNAGHPERPLVVAYYTVDTPYKHEAELLKISLESVGYGYEVCGVPNFGTWQKNTQAKAYFIQYMLERHEGQPLLYLDVDAVMVQPPVIMDTLEADIAAVHFNHQNELLSGTVFFGNTGRCKRVVRKWIAINERCPETLPNGKQAWDQRTLELAIQQVPNINYVELPQEYTWIVELTQKEMPDCPPPVIMHTRGAKRFKHVINGQKGYAK